MTDNQNSGEMTPDAVDSAQVQSPSEKLEETRSQASLIPGAENPASPEIKREVNLNTE